MKKIFYSICLIFLCASTAQAQDICNEKIQVKGSSIARCDQSSAKYNTKKYNNCSTTSWFSDLSSSVLNCYTKVMNKEWDERLLTLKKTNAEEFKKEMNLQKEFNLALKNFCQEFEKCDGTVFTPVQAGCDSGLVRYRSEQIQKIKQNQLSLVEGKKVDKNGLKFKKFAEALCALPSDLWKDAQMPADCENKALEEIQKNLRLNSEDVCLVD